jgi:hypothetical protein
MMTKTIPPSPAVPWRKTKAEDQGSSVEWLLRFFPNRAPRSRFLRLSVIVLLILLAAGCAPAGGPFVVNQSGDAGDSSPGDGFCRTGSSLTDCTLRAALQEANALAGTQTINFNLPAGSDYIYPASELPEITGDVVVDGTTQPGFDGGKPVVHVDGSHLGAAVPPTSGFKIAEGVNVTIKALQILRFPKDGIENYGNLALDHMEIAVNQMSGIDSFKASDGVNITINNSTIFENAGAGVNGINTHFTMDSVSMERNLGGGLRVVGGSLNLNHGTVADNATADDGGGIFLSMAANPAISNTTIEGNTSGHKGGGLYLWNLPASIMMVQSCQFEGNYGYDGGAVYIDAGTAHLSADTLTGNRAKHNGGGVFVNVNNEATLFVEAGTIIGAPGDGNIANSAPASLGLGGGIYNMKHLNIADSSVEGNTGDGIYNDGGGIRIQQTSVSANTLSGIESFILGATVDIHVTRSKFAQNGSSGIGALNANLTITQGSFRDNAAGGIRISGGTLTMDRSEVVGNHSGTEGGGIIGYNLTNAAITDTTVSGNSSTASGGGLYLWGLGMGAVLQMNNVTVSGNRAGTTGGGIEAASGILHLNNVTLAQNTAASAGGMHSAAMVNLTNTVLSENSGGNCGGAVASDGYNLDDATSCAFAGPGDLSGVPANLGPLQDNGGTTFTHALLPGSPALETGNDSTCLPADQRGVSRPQGFHCDMGAFESETPATATPPPVTSTMTPTLTPTKTPTSTPAPILFDPVNFSTEVMYSRYGRSCTPKQLTVQVKVSPPELVYSLGLFYRLVEKEGTNVTAWGGGLAMIPQGGGWYQLTIYSEDFPDTSKWGHEAWLEIQFVANGKDGKPIARSAVYRRVTLGLCYQ